MNKEQIIKDAILVFHPLSDELLSELASLFELKKYPAKHIILNEGDLCVKVGIIVKGLVRNFCLKENKNCTLWFDAEGSLYGSMPSIFNETISIETIETIEPTEILEIDVATLRTLSNKHEEIAILLRNILLLGYSILEFRIKELVLNSAIERYNSFFETNPKMVHRIPVKYLASYLGITPETMSRIRAKP